MPLRTERERFRVIDRDLEAGSAQVDPMLEMNEGRASGTHVVLASGAIVLLLAIFFYGVSHQRQERETTASAPAAETSAAAPAVNGSSGAAPTQAGAISQQNPGQPQQQPQAGAISQQNPGQPQQQPQAAPGQQSSGYPQGGTSARQPQPNNQAAEQQNQPAPQNNQPAQNNATSGQAGRQ